MIGYSGGFNTEFGWSAFVTAVCDTLCFAFFLLSSFWIAAKRIRFHYFIIHEPLRPTRVNTIFPFQTLRDLYSYLYHFSSTACLQSTR